jgi:putative heme iron utilization protein
VTYAADDRGRPVLLLSGVAVHAKNLAADSRASLVVFDEKAEHNPLGSPRLNLLGEVRLISQGEVETARNIYLARHPKSVEYLKFADFSFYRMEIFDIYYIAGFGDMGWASVSEYASV